MESKVATDSDIKNNWRSWPSPLGKQGEPKWLFEEGKDLVRAVHLGKAGSISEANDHNKILLLCQDGILYTNASGVNDYSELSLIIPNTDVEYSNFKVVDICKSYLNQENVLLVTDSGKAFLVNSSDGIILLDALKFKDANALDTSNTYNDFVYCASGEHHVALIDSKGKAWSTGKGPQTGHIAENLKQNRVDPASTNEEVTLTKIDFFQGLAVRAICCGSDFNVALVERIDDDDECISNVSQSIPSVEKKNHVPISTSPSRRISCPLGLPIEESVREKDGHNIRDETPDICMETPGMESFDEKPEEIVQLRNKSTDNSRDEVDGEEITNSQDKNVERLARSGIYMNPQDALKFLSDQLSWIGSGIGAASEEPEELPKNLENQIPVDKATNVSDTTELNGESNNSTKKIESNNVTNLGRAAGNLVTAMGQTVVSRISKSFSIDSSSITSTSNDDCKKTIDTIIDSYSPQNLEQAKNNIQSKADNEITGDSTDGAIPMESMIKINGSTKSSTISSLYPSYNREIEELAGNKENKLIPKNRSILTWSSSSVEKQKRRVCFQQHARSSSFGYPDSDGNQQEYRKNKYQSNMLGPKSKIKVENILLTRSKKLFDIEVLVWGKGTRGQLGQGDMLDRLQPSTVDELSGCGIVKVVCGNRHCLAMTITGVVYGWGDNKHGQACPQFPLAVCSVPKQIVMPVGEIASDIAAINDQTFILTDTGSIYTCGESDSENNTVSISGRNVKKVIVEDPVILNEEEPNNTSMPISNRSLMVRKILCSKESIYVCLTAKYLPICNYKALEKSNLNKLRQITQKVLEPLCNFKNDGISRNPSERSLTVGSVDDVNNRARTNLINSVHNLIDWLVTSVCTSWDVVAEYQVCQLLLLKQVNNFCESIETYTKHVCDCLVAGCLLPEKESSENKSILYSTTKKIVTELLSSLYYEKLPASEDTGHTPSYDHNIALQKLLLHPISMVGEYLSCIKNIYVLEKNSIEKCNTKNTTLEECITALKKTKRNVENEQQIMSQTIEFWEACAGKLPNLKIPSRRLVLDSRTTPIGLAHSGSFSKHWLILMNDILVHAGYSTHIVHPLQTVWIENHQNLWLESHHSSASSLSSVSSLSSTNSNKSTTKSFTSSAFSITGNNKNVDNENNGIPNSSSVNPSNDRFEISLVMPEDTLILVASSSEHRSVWLNGLQKNINEVLSSEKRQKLHSSEISQTKAPRRTEQNRGGIAGTPISRATTYTFRKVNELKNTSYSGSWMYGKIHGEGTLSWLDGSRKYVGQFRQSHKHGLGKMEILEGRNQSLKTIFDGQWKWDKFEGNGTLYYSNGDVYKGMFKDGRPHGHGILKQGRFMGTGASVYVGEWVNGLKSGYGVLDDIITGEKYMGMWYNDMKCGSGCVVTVDGVYYEGTFAHNKMTGRGLMIFEDDTIYDGNLADAGVFSGHGVLTYANGDHLEGSFYGNYTDGMKFNGTIYKTVRCSPNMIKGQLQCHHSNDQHDSVSTANSIGRYSVIPAQKWNAIFSSYHQLLCLPDPISHHDILKYSQISKKSARNDNKRHDVSTSTISVNTPVVWEQLAIQINQNKNLVFSHKRNSNACEASRTIESHNSSVIDLSGDQGLDLLDCLEIIPDYYHTTLTSNYYKEVTSYLRKAFSNKLHPLANLLNTVTDCYTATYGGVRIHPRLLRHAVDELNSLVNSLYYIVCAMFPALPKPGHQLWIDFEKDSTGTQQNEEGEMVTPSSIMHPHILPKIHPSIFMLYALHYKKDDAEYWLRILKWNRHPDIALLSFLGVDQKFWCLDFIQNHQHDKDDGEEESLPPSPVQNYSRSISLVRDNHFVQAIETLQQLKTNFTPFEKLTVILETFREVNKTGLAIVGKEHVWSMDDLFPVFQYIVVRARILQLGAEIHMIEDLMESHHMLGEYGIMFTTLQASYYQILKESLSIV